jgi:hypothetical protein
LLLWAPTRGSSGIKFSSFGTVSIPTNFTLVRTKAKKDYLKVAKQLKPPETAHKVDIACAATQTNKPKTQESFAQRMFLFAGILQTLETSCKMSRFPNEEKVPGSSPGRPTLINTQLTGKT